MTHVFVSYTRPDREVALQVAKNIDNRTIHTAWIDKRNIRVGGSWHQEIDDALRSAHAVVVLLSPAAHKSEYVTYEWSFALGAKVRVVPVMVAKVKDMHARLNTLQYVDFTSRKKDWRALIGEVSKGKSSVTKSHAPFRKIPKIFATFELQNGKPVTVGDSYDIRIKTRGVPPDTRHVKYEILDESFSDNKFTVGRKHRDFEESITSWGDVVISAKGTSRGRVWRTQTTLSQALLRGHGRKPPSPIQKALNEIKKK